MKRPSGVTASAVFVLIGSLGMLGFFAIFIMTMVMTKNMAGPPEARFVLPMVLAMYGFLSAWGLATAVGLFRLRNWARISIIVFSVLLAFTGLVTGPAMLLVPAPASAPPNFHEMIMVIAAAEVALGLLGGFWLYYFNRRSTREAFRGGAAPVESARPLSISIIGWWLLAVGMMAPISLFTRFPAVFLAWVLTGWAGVAVNLVYASIWAPIGYGLLRLKPLARVAAIWLFGFAVVNSVVFYAVPGWDARFATLMSSFSFGSRFGAQPPPPMHFSVLLMLPLTLLTLGVPLWFLIRTKSAFETNAARFSGN